MARKIESELGFRPAEIRIAKCSAFLCRLNAKTSSWL
jgi:hypothetical protein